MPLPTKLIGRPPVQQNMLLRHLRTQIVRGELPPGSRMPTRDELERRFGVSRTTTQRVFDALVRERFVESRGALGTFVSQTPPHLYDYGLVFWTPFGKKGWRRFDTAILNEASAIDDARDCKMRFYYGIDDHSDFDDRHYQLIADAHANRLAGIIFTTNPRAALVEELMRQSPQTPLVAIVGTPDIANVVAVTPSYESFKAKAMDYLVDQGRRRVAFLNSMAGTPAWQEKRHADLSALAAAKGMKSEPQWMLTLSATAAMGARNVIHLLFGQDKANRPDCLFITDDNLVEHATAGLMAAGVRVPEDVDVVAHCNFPWPAPSAMPIKRLGYDAREVLRQCVSIIDMQRRGQIPPKQVFVEAVFEEELAAAVSEQHMDS